MKLNEMVTLWQIKNPTKTNLFDGITLPTKLTQEFCYNLILLEYGDMDVLYNDSPTFYLSVSMFWQKHTPILNKLLETEDYTYDPLEDHTYKTHRVADGSTDKDFNGTIQNHVNAFNQQSGDSPQSRQTNINHNDGTWEDEYTITRSGMNRYTYQQLIEQQRRVVDFHPEDYILRHWAQEIMIAKW